MCCVFSFYSVMRLLSIRKLTRLAVCGDEIALYESIKPPSGRGKLLWHALGAKTIELVHENIVLDGIDDDLETLVLDADVLEGLIEVFGTKGKSKRNRD